MLAISECDERKDLNSEAVRQQRESCEGRATRECEARSGAVYVMATPSAAARQLPLTRGSLVSQMRKCELARDFRM